MPDPKGAARPVDESYVALRDDALTVFAAGVEAADPARAVKRALRIGLGGGAVIGRDEVLFPGKLRIVAVGKAACTMAQAALEVLPPQVFEGPGIAIVNDENFRAIGRMRVLKAGHPLPDSRGEAAVREVEKYLSGSRREDGTLVLISGGGSALAPAPADGITLEEKIAVTKLLLHSGADIGEMNAVRKHLSRTKGGGLAARAHPAALEALILSDVIGDDLSTIASGPTAPDPTTFAQARDVLVQRGVWGDAPEAVRARIERGMAGSIAETPKPPDAVFAKVRNRIVGSNALSLEAAAKRAAELGYEVVIASRALTGEASDAARMFAARLGERSKPAKPVAILAGGETTVTVRGAGRGGRNQELALAFSVEARKLAPAPRVWAFLSGGTDGRDGPTDSAGAIVDPGTIARGESKGHSAHGSLEANDSYSFLEASGDHLRTGPTGTNVADLHILLVR